MKFTFAFTVILSAYLNISAQFYNIGQAPASVKWIQIKTEHTQIIFPSGYYSEANKVANILEFMYDYNSSDYSRQPKKISIILYNQSVLSNGFVTLAPRRSEWVTTPPQQTLPQDWLSQLSLHEYRHVIQLDNLEQGITKALKFVFGEMAVGAITAYLPFWFLEGDAVIAETAFSSSGRGRETQFMQDLRCIELTKESRYSYDQSYLGSYKYYIPNHYQYGYHMVASSKLNYNINIWDNTLKNVARKPYLLAPFYFGLRKNGAGSKEKLYHNTFDSLKQVWKNDYLQDALFETQYIPTSKHKNYTSYLFPVAIKGKIYAVRTSKDDITRFIEINNDAENVIHTPGLYMNSPPAITDEYIFWEELIPDTRWQQKSYSVIKKYSYADNSVKCISKKTRYFSPSASPTGDSLVIVHIDEQNNYSLVLLDSDNGRKIKEVSIKSNDYIISPVWISSSEIAFISLNENGKNIVIYDFKEDKHLIVYKSGFINIEYLEFGNGYLFFAYDKELVRNIYAFNLKTNRIYRITSSEYGANYPSYDNEEQSLYYSDYTPDGYRIAKINIADSSNWKSSENIEKYNWPIAKKLSAQTSVNIQLNEIPSKLYDTLGYNRIIHSLNIHSWLPFYFNPDDVINLESRIYPGFTLLSQNKLSTVTSSLGYFYTNNSHYLEPKLTLARFYPVVEFSALVRNNPSFTEIDTVDIPDNLMNYYRLTVNIYLPLNFTRNRFYTYLQPQVGYTYNNRYVYDELYLRGISYMKYSFYGSILLKKSARDINPKLGQTIYLSYVQPLGNNSYVSDALIVSSNTYLPGFFRHHGLHINLGYENQNQKRYTFGNQISLPRGFIQTTDYNEIKKGSFEYTLPLFYPDWSLGPIAYIKRFHARLFHDVALTDYNEIINKEEFSSHVIYSFGVSLHTDMNFFRFILPFTPCIAYSYLPQINLSSFQFYITVNTSVF
ncbi:MAG: hypothetical protein JW894_08995 [Bacteroidales bacterium]|nr:hypothetical protein [Bacteroidales bacterium]